MSPLAVLIGIAPIVGGIVVLRYRERLAAWNAAANRKAFGQYGERVAKNSTAGWIAVLGVGLILIGVVWLLRVIFPG